MEIIAFKRDQEEYRRHLERIRDCAPIINNKTPESLSLTHLKNRAKKIQIREDRKQSIAMDNKKLMENMTRILSEGRRQEPHIRAPSKNERVRREAIDKINRDNKSMVSRLEGVPPIIESAKMKEDFSKHVSMSLNLRRRHQMLQNLAAASGKSPIRSTPKPPIESESPIRTVSQFRAEVIGKKKQESRPELRSSIDILSQFENLSHPMHNSSAVRFQMTNNPNSK